MLAIVLTLALVVQAPTEALPSGNASGLTATVVDGTLSPNDPDALYRQRAHRPNAQAAADIWDASAATDFTAAWKLARACYWLGTHGAEAARRDALERGVRAGEVAVRLAAERPEGHFWMAANMGTLAEAFGLSQGLKYRGRIREALEKVLAFEPGWQQGSAEAALGRWYARVPRLLGGNKGKAEAFYRKALAVDPSSRPALFYYAELIKGDRPAEARGYLERILAAPPTPGWEPEDADWQVQARELLLKIPSR